MVRRPSPDNRARTRSGALARNASIVDLGAGTGGNLTVLGHFGRVAAMEPDDGARAIAAARNNVDIRAGALPGAILQKALAA